MARIQKTVFISYRRTDGAWALIVHRWLKSDGYDVFIDHKAMGSGSFEAKISDEIRSRAHFLVVLSPNALERCSEAEDVFRREIETAIQSRRNLVSIFVDGFAFDKAARPKLPAALEVLPGYNGWPIEARTFEFDMTQLAGRFLNVDFDDVVHPASNYVPRASDEPQRAADAETQPTPAAIQASNPPSLRHSHIDHGRNIEYRFNVLRQIAIADSTPESALLARKIVELMCGIRADTEQMVVEDIARIASNISPENATQYFLLACVAEWQGKFRTAYRYFQNHQRLGGKLMPAYEMASALDRQLSCNPSHDSSLPLTVDTIEFGGALLIELLKIGGMVLLLLVVSYCTSR